MTTKKEKDKGKSIKPLYFVNKASPKTNPAGIIFKT